jgi:hypothetical protein
MRRTYNAIFVGTGVQPLVPLLETTSLRSMETVLRREPNAIAIVARDGSRVAMRGADPTNQPTTGTRCWHRPKFDRSRFNRRQP